MERPSGRTPAPVQQRRRPERARLLPQRWFVPGWPIGAAVALYPLWWFLGVAPLVLPVTGVVLAAQLRRRRERLIVPPGFWIWLAFLLVVVVSGVMLNLTIPDTLPPSGIGHYAAYVIRLISYVAVALMMLFFINTSEEEFPAVRLMRWIGALAVSSIGLGLISIRLPGFSFPTVASLVVPASLSSVLGGQASLAQLQPVLGVVAPRPAAPFVFTNAWGCALALMLVWLLVAGWAARWRVRVATALVMVIGIVPIVYSLNRGMWIGMALGIVYVAARLAARGRVLVIGVLALGLGVGTVAFVASPLQTLVTQRVSHGHSNDIRTSLGLQALTAAAESPLLGYGSTRKVLGSSASIAVGSTKSCPKCGNADIGSTGQFLLLLVSQGFLGTGLYIGYFVRTLWAYRRDASPVGIGGSVVLVMSLFFGIAYNGLDIPLAVTFLSVGLLYRNSEARARVRRSATHA